MPLHYYLPWVVLISIGLAGVAYTIIYDYRERKRKKK
jgi:4-hydroxybenzoate polyprenyltransferase